MEQRIFNDRIVLFKEDGIHVAVSLNFYLVAEADDMETAFKRLKDATTGYLEVAIEDGDSDEEIYRQAPKEYQNMWDNAIEVNRFPPHKPQKGVLKKKENSILKKEVRVRTEAYEPSMVS